MLLENKTAVIYGGGGSIGGAMARAFAAEGARVFLAGRTPATLDAVAEDIRRAGGLAETAVVDALDGAAVNGWVDSVAGITGSVDISVNLISQESIFKPLLEMPIEDFGHAMDTLARSFLLTAQAAARHMVKQGSGVILHFGGSDSGIPESMPDIPETEHFKRQMVDATLLGRAATLADVGRVAAFLVSDHARTITSTQVNVSCGALVD
jgi:NAD(P)-dependent dehydrogenase (short-subunit alcohol dehydrogenase family)